MKDQNRVALITGGTSGIGLAAAKKFLLNGYQVAVCSIDPPAKVDAAMRELRELGEVVFHELNVADEAGCKEAVSFVADTFGHIDVLLNVAGIVGTLRPITDTDMEDVRKTVQVNLMGTIQMAYFAALRMKEQGSGVIVNTSSISGSMATNVGVGYHASKGGVNMATKVMALALAPYGIRVVAVAPGSVNTGMQDSKYAVPSARYMLRNRLIEPEEVANIMYLLCLPEAAAVNGTVVMADDGFTAWKGILAD